MKSSDPHKGGTEGPGTQTVPNKDFSRIKVCGVYLSFNNKGYIEKCKMSMVLLYLTSESNSFDMSPLTQEDQKMASSSKPVGPHQVNENAYLNKMLAQRVLGY